ncbi:unnamed protein product [Arctia plantaginis]|uniref:Uncharacterized protein n=1 Tax=Arctia plantaginis TaxID=874455 RepID=A0A8S0Z0N9_ARCPL|nr:unnamed protein product [Arctia plantaginis]
MLPCGIPVDIFAILVANQADTMPAAKQSYVSTEHGCCAWHVQVLQQHDHGARGIFASVPIDGARLARAAAY